jgi:hypothetical protein
MLDTIMVQVLPANIAHALSEGPVLLLYELCGMVFVVFGISYFIHPCVYTCRSEYSCSFPGTMHTNLT